MTITTYAQLKEKFTAATTNWMARPFTEDEADEFIDLFEAFASQTLRCREMQTTTSLTPVSNVCTIPSDYVESIRVVEEASRRRRLEYISADAADALYPSRTAGLACHFMIVGSELTALPLSSNDIELTYYRTIPALTSLNTTNWLLTKMPGAYLHGCMMQAAEYIRDPEKLNAETALTLKMFDTLAESDARGQFGNAGVTLTGPVW